MPLETPNPLASGLSPDEQTQRLEARRQENARRQNRFNQADIQRKADLNANLSSGQVAARQELDEGLGLSTFDKIGDAVLQVPQTIGRLASNFAQGFGSSLTQRQAQTRFIQAQANAQQAQTKEKLFGFQLKQRQQRAIEHAPKTSRKLASETFKQTFKKYMKDSNIKEQEMSYGDFQNVVKTYNENMVGRPHLQFNQLDDDALMFVPQVQGDVLRLGFIPHDILKEGMQQDHLAELETVRQQGKRLNAQSLLANNKVLEAATALLPGQDVQSLTQGLQGEQSQVYGNLINNALSGFTAKSIAAEAALPAQEQLARTKAAAKGKADILTQREADKQKQKKLAADVEKANKDRTSREKVATAKNLNSIEGIQLTQDLIAARERGITNTKGTQAIAQLKAKHEAKLAQDQANIGSKIVLQTLEDLSKGERLTETLAAKTFVDLQKGAGDATTRFVMKALHETGQVDLIKIAKGLKAGSPLNSILFDAITDVHEDVSVENEINKVLSDPGAKGSTETALLGIKSRFNLEEGSPGAQRVDEAVRSIQTPLTDNAVLTGMQKVIRQAATHAKVGTFDPITGQINSLTLFENNPKDTNKYIQSLEDSLTTFPELARGIRPLVKRLKAIRDREETGKTTHKGFTTALPNHGDLTKIQFSRPGGILGGLSPNDITLGQMLDELKEDGEYTDPKGRQQKIFKRDTKEEKVRYFRNDDGDVQANVTKDGETRGFTLEQFKDSIEWIPIKE